MKQLGPWLGGITNTVSSTNVREAPGRSGEPAALLDAVNVDIDRDGAVRPRTRWQNFAADSAHSLFEHNGQTYGSVGGYVCRLTGSTVEQIRQVEGPLAWTVLNGEPLYAAHDEVRVIRGLTAAGLPADERDDEAELLLTPMPGGSAVAYWQGRLLLARGNSLIWSEPLRFGVFNPMQNFVTFEERVRWVAPLDGGIYVGLRNSVRWLAGSDPAQFEQSVAAEKPGPGAVVPTSGMDPRLTGGAEEVAVWMTDRGFAVGQPNGSVSYPQADRLKNLPLGTGRLVVSSDRITVI